MRSLYGNRWTSAQGEFDDNGVWYGELQHHAPQAIQRGLMRCRDQLRDAARQSDTAWPPQAAEFSILCEPQPSDYGLPNEMDAWAEANANAHAPDQHQWSHAAVRVAANAVSGGFREIHGCTSQSRRAALQKQFVRQYLALVNRHGLIGVRMPTTQMSMTSGFEALASISDDTGDVLKAISAMLPDGVLDVSDMPLAPEALEKIHDALGSLIAASKLIRREVLGETI